MLIERLGFEPLKGRVTYALTQVVEQLFLGRTVVYMTNDLTYEEIIERIREISDEVEILDLIVDKGSSIKEVIETYPEDVVIVADILKDVSYVNCKQELFVYYQEKNI